MSAAETEKSGTFKGLKLTNTLTRQKEDFLAIDDGNVRLYVCGPTVYDFAHIGNARPVIVFDVLFRLLRHLYGADHVTYARNITDVDAPACFSPYLCCSLGLQLVFGCCCMFCLSCGCAATHCPPLVQVAHSRETTQDETS